MVKLEISRFVRSEMASGADGVHLPQVSVYQGLNATEGGVSIVIRHPQIINRIRCSKLFIITPPPFLVCKQLSLNCHVTNLICSSGLSVRLGDSGWMTALAASTGVWREYEAVENSAACEFRVNQQQLFRCTGWVVSTPLPG